MDTAIDTLREADKVVIAGYWYALLGDQLFVGAVPHGRILLETASTINANMSENAARARRMLSAVDVSAKLASIIKKLDEADAHIEKAQGYLSDAGSGPTEQQRKDAAALLRGTPEFIPSERC